MQCRAFDFYNLLLCLQNQHFFVHALRDDAPVIRKRAVDDFLSQRYRAKLETNLCVRNADANFGTAVLQQSVQLMYRFARNDDAGHAKRAIGLIELDVSEQWPPEGRILSNVPNGWWKRLMMRRWIFLW